MSTPPNSPRLSGTSRRTFLHASGAAVGAGLTNGALFSPNGERVSLETGRARGDEELGVALVGCGGRGTGAAGQALSTSGAVKLIAMADAFGDRLEGSLNTLKKNHADKVDVPEDRCFTGFDAY
jgi:myo-inositol 2-dehydrogenase/D-chiro-inositol 1-dehydrogenase